MARYTKKDVGGRCYIEGANGKLESNIKGHIYGEAIERFAELENALDLVNRQKAEIERLQADIDGACVFLEEQNKKRTQEHKIQMELLNKLQEQIPLAIARAKSEAIKEFAERLKAKEATHFCKCGRTFTYTDLFNGEIDTIVKEMTEGQK
jgi:hypothetical protein